MDQNVLLELLRHQMPPAAAAAWQARLSQPQGPSQNELLQKISSLLNNDHYSRSNSTSSSLNFMDNKIPSMPQEAPKPIVNQSFGQSNVPLSHALFRQTLAPLVADSQGNECSGNEILSPNSILSGPESTSHSPPLVGASQNSFSSMGMEQILKAQLFQQDRVNPFASPPDNTPSCNFDSVAKTLLADRTLADMSANMNMERNQLVQQLLLLHRLSLQNQQSGSQDLNHQLPQQLEPRYPQNQNQVNLDDILNQSLKFANNIPSNLLVGEGDFHFDSLRDATWLNANSNSETGLHNVVDPQYMPDKFGWDNALAEPVDIWQNLKSWHASEPNFVPTKNLAGLAGNLQVNNPVGRTFAPQNAYPSKPQTSAVSASKSALQICNLKGESLAAKNVRGGDVNAQTANGAVLSKAQNLDAVCNRASQILALNPTRRKRGAATDLQSLAARARRERITRKMRTLHELVPGGRHLDTAAMLQQAIEYVQSLQSQLKAAKEQGLIIKSREESEKEARESEGASSS